MVICLVNLINTVLSYEHIKLVRNLMLFRLLHVFLICDIYDWTALVTTKFEFRIYLRLMIVVI